MKQLKLGKIFFVLCFIGLFSFSGLSQSKISCKESSAKVGDGSTFFLRNEGKLKNVSGNVMFPDGSPAYVNITIYKNVFNRNEGIDYKEVAQIVDDENQLKICESDDKGRFEINGLRDGFYLLKIGNDENGGFGPENILIQISRKRGKKKKLLIDLGAAI